MELKYALVLVLSLGVFIGALKGHEKLALKAIVFSLSFAATPFRSDGLLVGLSGIMIITLWLGVLMQKNGRPRLYDGDDLGSTLKFLVYFLVGGIALAFLQTNYDRDTATDISAGLQILNYSLYIIILIIFVKMMLRFKDDREFQHELMHVFILSAFVHLAVIVLTIFGYGSAVPSFLVSSEVTREDFGIEAIAVRFSGLIGDYELLVDYCMIAIGLALVLVFRKEHRLTAALSIVAAFITALSTGTRSFLVIVAVFAALIFLFYAIYHFDPTKITKIVILTVGVWFCAVYIYSIVFPDDIIFRRLEVAFDLLRAGDVEGASNRNLLSAVPDFLGTTPIWGYGSLFLNVLDGNEIVSHNVFLAAYAKYGFIGIYAVLALFVQTFIISFRTIRTSTVAIIRDEGIVMFALAAALFLQELKISALRMLPSLLIYTFFFLLVYFLAREAGVVRKNASRIAAASQ